GPKHLVSLTALIVLLIAGIAVVGFFAFKRSKADSQTAAAPPVTSEPAGGAAAQPDQQPAVTEAQPPTPAPAEVTPAIVPPPTPPPTKPATPSAAAQAGAAARKAKAAAAKVVPEAVVVAPVEPAPPPVVEPPPPPKPEVPPVTFKDVRVLVLQGDSMREREAVLTLAGDHLSVSDRSGKAQILSLPYASIQQAYYSRSKQPRWKSPDGKGEAASVDLGKMGFFRGERNWVILTTQGAPIFIRFEDSALKTVLPAIQERIGMKIQR
nr:hypothetical protein [Acidobacteriota bacterium]